MNYKYENLVVAYGSNLCGYDFNNFAQKYESDESCLHFEHLVFLPDYQLCFDVKSKGRKGGVLNIRKSLGCITEAGLFSANAKGLELLRRKEGVPFKYQEVDIIAIDGNGDEINALTYIVSQDKTEGFVAPHPEYLKVCEDGYKQRGICSSNLHLAAKNQKIEPWPGIFTYGTLMRKESRYHIIGQLGVGCSLMAQCFGTLTTNGNYPALNLNGNGFSWGDLIFSDDIVSLLEKTDQIEGFVGFGSTHNLFRRTFVQVDIGRLRYAWVYVMDRELDIRILSNDWRNFQGKRLNFIEDIHKTHSAAIPNFNEQVTSRIFRWSDKKNKAFSSDQIINMLNEGQALTEWDLAKVTGLWAAEAS